MARDLLKKRAAHRAWRGRNAAKVREKERQLRFRRAEVNRPKLEMFQSRPCADCGRFGSIHAHHLRDKKFHLGGGIFRSEAAFDAEIDKCVPLCASCHWARHKAVRQNSPNSDYPDLSQIELFK